MIKKHFFKGLSWLIFLNLIIKPVWIFAIDRQVQNIVGHQLYGTYFALFNLSFVLLFIADAGLSNMMAQRIAGKIAVSSRQLLQLKIVLLLFYFIACCFVGWISDISEWRIFLYIIIIQLLASLFLFLRSLLTAHQFFKTDAFFSVIDKGLMIFLCSGFIYAWWQPITLELFLQLQLVSTALATCILLLFLLRNRLIEQGRKEKLSLIIKWITPFALIILLMAMHYRLDGFLLERLRPDGAWQAGVYATAYRLLDAGNMIGYLTASFLVPFIARNNKDNKLIETVISRLQHALMLIAIGTSCFAFVFAPWIQEVLYHTTDPYNNKVIQLCLAVLPAYYLIHIYGSALTATSNFRLFITILLVSFILNVCLNCWLIPKDGALGSCIAALVSQYSCGLACYLAVTRKLSFSRSIMPFAVYIIGAAFLFLSFSLLKTNIHPVWIILAAMVLLFVILATSQVKILKRLFSSFIQ